MLKMIENGLVKLGSIVKRLTLISFVHALLSMGAILAIMYILSLNMESKDGKVLKEGFVSSPRYPETYSSLLLDSIYERDRSGVFKTFKNQISNLPTSCMGEYKQNTNNPLEQGPCGGKDTNPNMCLYSKVKKVKNPKERRCRPTMGRNRVGWFMTKG